MITVFKIDSIKIFLNRGTELLFNFKSVSLSYGDDFPFRIAFNEFKYIFVVLESAAF